MTNEGTLVWCLLFLYFQVNIGESSRHAVKLSDRNRCDFNNSRLIYNAMDLLQCMNVLADISIRSNSRSQPNSSTRQENSYGLSVVDLISNLFNNEALSSSDDADPPLDPAVSYYQLNRPTYPSDQSGGFGVNLFDALTSISRYDDLKCVPRILCEVASGRQPGKYKQTSAYLGDLGRNAFTQWLTAFDVTGTSPILNFARAAALGYSSGGDPTTCYHAFPRCPRNPNKLVHYLNNHNGGFFRFFNGRIRGSHPQSQLTYSSRDYSQFLHGLEEKAPPPGYAGAKADRTGTGELKFDVPTLSAHRNYGERFLQEENLPESSGRVVFPVHEELNDRPSRNEIPEVSSEHESPDVNILPRDSPSFFPRESDDQNHDEVQVHTNWESNGEFRFPR